MQHSTIAQNVKSDFNPLLASSNFSELDNVLIIPKSQKQKFKKPQTGYEIKETYIQSKFDFGKALDKSISQEDKIITLVLDIFAIDDLNELDRENAEIIRNFLKYYPKNANKFKEFDGLTPLEIAKLNQTLKKPTLSARTIRGVIQKMSTFCSWCVNHGYINTNHFHKLETLPPKSDDIRLEFNDEQLSSIFRMSDYTSCNFKHNYYYWIPLLLRLTGARLNELCQLWCQDIQLIDNVWCIVIHEKYYGQRVKNVQSARIIPIHSALLERGFIEFVQSLNTERVFDELKLFNGYYSHNASKWFSRRRTKLGLGKGLDAHSFRHSCAAELKRNGVSTVLIEELLGHRHNSISLDLYGKKFQPNELLKVVNLIDDSHLSHIKAFHCQNVK
ncbi:site-specific integrase [Vibrio comitans]|uniref:Tyr recombinase domain-containing protein n=1 Tax=Vibrio comitans NBRC 102076 TaxID=1219078 RepID=A0A4Y3IJQ4_9VIBR|nr:site-specific integrase [Vibrio comitans]GEA59606.1 hypothetical protein VCO01S_07990 [Vibrio comitans NBRC 102076]